MPTHAFVLHQRAFQETSALIECFTQDHGIVALVARGVKRPRSRWYGAMQPFLLLQIDWVGKTDFKTLTQVEAQGLQPALRGAHIRIGMYLNELLLRLLHRGDPHPAVFQAYHETLLAIGALDQTDGDQQQQETLLRRFELLLLADLGYGLDFNCEPDLLYCYEPDRGLIEAVDPASTQVASGATFWRCRKDN